MLLLGVVLVLLVGLCVLSCLVYWSEICKRTVDELAFDGDGDGDGD